MLVKEAKGKLEGVYDYVIPKSREKRCFFEQAIDIAIESMEKQIPMKIKEIHVDEYYCPACGAELNCNDAKVNDNYCSECGQRFWMEEGESNAGS